MHAQLIHLAGQFSQLTLDTPFQSDASTSSNDLVVIPAELREAFYMSSVHVEVPMTHGYFPGNTFERENYVYEMLRRISTVFQMETAGQDNRIVPIRSQDWNVHRIVTSVTVEKTVLVALRASLLNDIVHCRHHGDNARDVICEFERNVLNIVEAALGHTIDGPLTSFEASKEAM